MKEIIFKGCGTALVTPFTNENTINFIELKKLIEYQILEGTDSIIICGTTGESSTMTLEEKKSVIDFTVKTVNKRIPVIAGTGSNSTESTIEMSKIAEQLNVDGLLIVTPYYNKTTQSGIVAHYSKIANSVELPIILYNVPSRTGVNILPETCYTLSKIQNIVAIKEASGNISQIAEILNLCKNSLNIYSGNDDQIIPTLSLGGIGVISVLANLYPKYTHTMIENYCSGNIVEAKNKQLEAIPVIKALFSEVNPIPIKYALNSCGFDVGIPRLPLVELSDICKNIIDLNLKKFAI